MKILFIVPYPTCKAPSQRFRFEQYFQRISLAGHTYHVSSFLTAANWKVFYKPGSLLKKTVALLKGFSLRLSDCFTAHKYDLIFIHREASPVGPPIFEWFLARILRKKIIYDFDDAIWLTDKPKESLLEKLIRFRGKVSLICKWSYRISCGNEYLANFARLYNSLVIVNPTTIDTKKTNAHLCIEKKRKDEQIIIGWTGSHTTLKYLESIKYVLQDIERQLENVSFLVIANRKPTLDLKRLEYIEWREQTEIEDILKMDIGLMPLPDDEWTKGKCGFKALQYMSLGIPCVVSPVGVNSTIIQHSINGFLEKSDADWIKTLKMLVNDEGKRKDIGKKAIETVNNKYSVDSNTQNFLQLFE
jgi:glycosyltransferase involved in cell wall biosynthesis